MKKSILLLALSSFSLVGCADKVTTTTIDQAGKSIETIASASTSKQLALFDLWKTAIDKIADKNNASGIHFEITGMQETPNDKGGVDRLVLFKFDYTPQTLFPDLPKYIPPHWGKDVFMKALDVASFGITGYFLNDFGKSALESAGTSQKYNGDYFFNSYNQTAEPYFAPITE